MKYKTLRGKTSFDVVVALVIIAAAILAFVYDQWIAELLVEAVALFTGILLLTKK